MAFTSPLQDRQTYLLGRQFSLPTEHGSRNAIAVSDTVGLQLVSAYTIMIELIVVNSWCIILAISLFLLLKRPKNKGGVISSTLWNERSSFEGALWELVSQMRQEWKHWWIYPLIFLVLAALVTKIALSIIIPAYVVIDTAAPVNPAAVVVPALSEDDQFDLEQRLALDLPAVLRAVGITQSADEETRKRIRLVPQTLGHRPDQQAIMKIDYGYDITGVEFGLQNYPDLKLSVSGSCITEYGWLFKSYTATEWANLTGDEFAMDLYTTFDGKGGPMFISPSDAPVPTAKFTYDANALIANTGNYSWALLVSSIGRSSYSPSSDPFYQTGDLTPSSDGTKASYTVRPGRPVLSCWQSDIWSYRGRSGAILSLGADGSLGVNLPTPLHYLFIRYLFLPQIIYVGSSLRFTALQSSLATQGGFFNGHAANIVSDLERLLLTAYICSVNTFSDMTLHPPVSGENTASTNMARDPTGAVLDGVANFIVRSPNIATLSITALVVIPVLLLFTWALMSLLLKWSPMKIVTVLEGKKLYQALVSEAPLVKPTKQGEWAAEDTEVVETVTGEKP